MKIPRFARNDNIMIVACIVVIGALAWAYLVHLEREMTSMAAMGMTMDSPWTVTDLGFTFTMWAVMMVGMMSATVAPMLLLFSATHARRVDHRSPLRVPLFSLGYITVWVGFSLLAALAQWGLHEATLLSMAMAAANPHLAGAMLIAAGAYQLTPFKRACLEHCRSPLDFLMSHWRDGSAGAFHMGLRHGLYCLGCCWALMCVLFAVGIMNLAWVAVLSVFVLLERVGRGGVMVARVGGAALIVFGLLVIMGRGW